MNCRVAPGASSVTLTVLKSTTGVPGSGVATALTLTFSGATVIAEKLDVSVDIAAGEYVALEVSNAGGAVAAIDMVVQIDVY
jgi:hypothetical protein